MTGAIWIPMVAGQPELAASSPSWLDAVRARAQRRTLWCRELWSGSRYAGEETMAITHSEVDRALADPAQTRDAEHRFYAEQSTAATLTTAIAALERDRADPRWQHLQEHCSLTRGDAALLACALAAEHTPALRRVYGYLQDEVSPLDVTTALAAALFELPETPRIGPDSALVRWRLARPADPAQDPGSSATGWRADPRVLGYLLGDEPQEWTLVAGPVAPAGPVLFAPALREITQAVRATIAPPGRGIEIELIAPAGAGKATLAAQAARELGRRLWGIDCRAVARLEDPASAAIRELRHARLADAIVLWRHPDALSDPVWAELGGRAPVAFLTSAHPLPAPTAASRVTFELPPLDRARRLALWSAVSDGPPPVPVAEWRLHAGEVVACAQLSSAGEEPVRAMCRRRLGHRSSDLVRQLPLPYGWDDLIAGEELLGHLREFAAQCRQRDQVLDGWGLAHLTPLGRGVTALFSGPSGTGKTMAAQIVARELGLDLLRVDLAGVVNKYIGETEKHLRAVFDGCERSPVMLFFDEADALFGRRMQVGDAHDRFANIEVDYLLQRMEEFDGVAVLATNRKGDIDTAFLRRLRFVVDFVVPTVPERERLWRAALEPAPDSAGPPLADELDYGRLAQELELTGAGIKASALAAAFLARSGTGRIGPRHVMAAARRELQKQGVVLRLGPNGGLG